jgi:chromosome segregation ATPase
VTPAAAAAAKGQKPLSNFERKALTRLEAEMEAISAKRAELQKKVNSFEAARNGYSELSEWTEEIEALAEQLDGTELRWLELEERANL